MKIGLNMIVKNEAHIILEGLECIWPLIDTYVIVDTGSTDNTKEIIKTFFDKKKIKGFLFDSVWKDFGTNRSEALKLCDGKMDYAIVFDADDLISIPPNAKEFLKLNLQNFNSALMRIYEMNGSLKHRRLQIFKTGDGWKYKDVLHEFATNEKENNKVAVLPEEFFMTSRRLGNRDRKLESDLKTLLEGLKNEPENERYILSIAQTYADMKKYDESIHYFKRRLEMNIPGSEEIHFISQYRMASCYAAKNNLVEAEYWANLAFQSRPSRSESLLFIAKCFRVSGEFYKAYQYILKGKDIPYPKNDLYFVLQEPYNGGFERESCLIEYNIFPEKREAIQKQIYQFYFFSNNLDLSCVVPVISKIKSKITPLCIDINFFGNQFRPCNLSMIDSEHALVRYVDYEIKNREYELLFQNPDKSKMSNKNALVNLSTLETREVLHDTPEFCDLSKPRGIEDVRIYKYNNKIYFTGNSYGEFLPDCLSVVHGEFDEQKNMFVNIKGINSPLQEKFEKNWLNVPDTDVFIYSWHPLRLCKIRDNKCIIFKVVETPTYFSLFRGSAQPIKINGKLVCLVHFCISEGKDKYREYYHVFVEMTDDGLYSIVKLSCPFYFRSPKSVEYCMCIQYNDSDKSIDCYTTYEDRDPALQKVLLQDISWFS